MASAMPALTGIWHTLRDTGKTYHCLQGKILLTHEFRCLALHARSYSQSLRCQAQVTAQRRSAQEIHQEDADKHSFFASEETNFASLGLQSSLVDALQGAGYDRPSTVQVEQPHTVATTSHSFTHRAILWANQRICLHQELSAPPILSGRSLVLAAETGSGKTMAYLAPLISSILSGKAQEADVQSTSSEGCLLLSQFSLRFWTGHNCADNIQ